MVGEAFGATYGNNIGYDRPGVIAGKAFAHGISQGALSYAGGGRFGDGFLAAAASALASPFIETVAEGDFSGNAKAMRITTAAMIGGTVSRIGGGSFANGAVTGAMVWAFNGEESYKKRYQSKQSSENESNGGLRDKAGSTRPTANHVIGPKGYWQLREFAQLEAAFGARQQASDLPISSNAPACVTMCTSIGAAVDALLGNDIAKGTKATSEILEAAPSEVHKQAGSVIRKIVLPARFIGVAVDLPQIYNACQIECSVKPFDHATGDY